MTEQQQASDKSVPESLAEALRKNAIPDAIQQRIITEIHGVDDQIHAANRICNLVLEDIKNGDRQPDEMADLWLSKYQIVQAEIAKIPDEQIIRSKPDWTGKPAAGPLESSDLSQ